MAHDTHTTQEESVDSRRRNVAGAILYCHRYKRSYGLDLSEIYSVASNVLTRAQKDQGTPFSYSPFDPPSNKVPQIVEIIMLEYLRVPRNFLGLWPLR